MAGGRFKGLRSPDSGCTVSQRLAAQATVSSLSEVLVNRNDFFFADEQKPKNYFGMDSRGQLVTAAERVPVSTTDSSPGHTGMTIGRRRGQRQNSSSPHPTPEGPRGTSTAPVAAMSKHSLCCWGPGLSVLADSPCGLGQVIFLSPPWFSHLENGDDYPNSVGPL